MTLHQCFARYRVYNHTQHSFTRMQPCDERKRMRHAWKYNSTM